MKPCTVKILLVLAGLIFLGMYWGCTYGQYEPDMWEEGSPILDKYDDDDSSDDDDDNNDSDSDSDSDSDKNVHPEMHRVPSHQVLPR